MGTSMSGSIRCYSCGGNHYKDKCPQLNSGKTGKCFHCQGNHFKAECPLLNNGKSNGDSKSVPSSRGRLMCFHCQGPHQKRDCPSLSKPAGAGSASAAAAESSARSESKQAGAGSQRIFGKCYNCGETGHTRASCPTNVPGACFVCGSTEGHRAVDCPLVSKQIMAGAQARKAGDGGAGAGASGGASDGGSDSACVVCLDAAADHCVLSCMHLCLCGTCAASLQTGAGGSKCPMCRGAVDSIKKVFK